MSETGEKRAASSPLQVDEKRQCVGTEGGDGSFLDSDSESTIMNPDFLSSTRIVQVQQKTGAGCTAELLKDSLKSILGDPEVVKILANSVAKQVSDVLRKEVAALKEQMKEKDREITYLKDKIDDLEQYSRRTSVRVSGVKEVEGEDTDAIMRKVAGAMGVDLPDTAIERSHRVGRKPTSGNNFSRAILVKFSSIRHKQTVMAAKKKLSTVDPRSISHSLPSAPSVPSTPATASASSPVRPRIYINEDLTKVRAEIAAVARDMKKRKVLQDTWTRDGVIFVKKGLTIHRVTTKHELEQLC